MNLYAKAYLVLLWIALPYWLLGLNNTQNRNAVKAVYIKNLEGGSFKKIESADNPKSNDENGLSLAPPLTPISKAAPMISNKNIVKKESSLVKDGK